MAERPIDMGHRRTVGNIPLRNIWLLLLYAHDKARFIGTYDAQVEASRDLDALLALLLADAVERRLRRALTRGYEERRAVLRRVRGRIDVLKTHVQSLFERGEVACRFDDHTNDTPSNRFVRRALIDVSVRIDEPALARRCRDLARRLEALGVGDSRGLDAQGRFQRLARHERDDEFMVTLARWVYDVSLPSEEAGSHAVASPDKDEVLVRALFERAIANFYRIELPARDGWSVSRQTPLGWQEESASADLRTFLPGMAADVVIEHRPSARRLVVETKFTNILTKNRYGADRFKSANVYQVYAYLRSQERRAGTPGEPDAADSAAALVLYPAVERNVDASAVFHGHRIHFATVDLGAPSESIRARLRELARRAF